MGSEADRVVFAPTFNRSIRVIAHDDRITGDAGMLALREVDHRLGITDTITEGVYDPRRPYLTRYLLGELVRQQVMGIAAGYGRQDDQDILAHDVAMRAATWDRPGSRVVTERLSSQPTQSRTLSILTPQREAIDAALAETLVRHRRARGERHRLQRGTLDVDTVPVTVHGRQAGSAYNGYYDRRIYLPLMAGFAPWGDYDHSRLGDGFVHARLATTAPTGMEALAFIRAAVSRSAALAQHLDVRVDAGFTVGEVMDGLQDDHTRFVGRLRNNARLDALAQPHLTRPAGRPPVEGYQRIIEMGPYQTEDWRHSFRLVLVIVDLPDPDTGCLQLCPHHFFLITNWSRHTKPALALLKHYRGRGSFEDRFSELNRALDLHLSCRDFDRNEAMLLLHLPAFNLVNIIRAEVERATDSGWDLRRVQETILKAGARVVHGGHKVSFYLASAAAAAWRVMGDALARWTQDAPKPPRPRAYVPPPAHAHLALVYRL